MLKVNVMVKVKFPGVVGVPLNSPLADIVKPGGKDPPLAAKLYEIWRPSLDNELASSLSP
jgi:hypothetical protein